jgi:hypothetical protein
LIKEISSKRDPPSPRDQQSKESGILALVYP